MTKTGSLNGSAESGLERLSLEARIYRAHAGLTRSEKRLADVLLEHQMDLPLFTAVELAEKAGVSKSTAARLIRALGYKSYTEAKRAIRTEQFWGSPQAGLPVSTEHGASAAKMMEADLENIRLTLATISEQRLSEIARRVAEARRVWIMGMRSGEGLALHADHYLNLIRDGVQILDYGAGALSRSVAAVGPGDLLLVIAFRRRPRVLVRLLEEARQAGAETLLITDRSAGASARAADMTLRCHTQSPAPFNSFAAAVTLINCLAWQVHAAMGASAIERYRRIDDLVSEFDDVSTPLPQK
ncbi:MurR/RpiR family transcriptional regulator [Salipiger abyssi]|uniref:MurR/RpiR family transcriptional regulator n=1 Tax=Salipiger abyssi TaxID=1250539 RepID=UPI001A8DA97D|nr:MurR/RpiR family transcriptional regulator [Salipiger abyssi]MBN9888947.1 MurR/RpiR family transcriptional regulator [Salipiger abyssi]